MCGDPGPRRRRPGPHPTAGLGPVRDAPCAARSPSVAGRSPRLRIARNLFAALADPAGVIAHRHGALERVAAGAGGLGRRTSSELADTERTDGRGPRRARAHRAGHLDPRDLARSAPRRSWPRPATRSRFATARAMVKHAGLAPREKLSGTFTGRTKLTGQGRPRLRVAAWRAVWGSLQTNTVYAARYRHLTTREHNKLTPDPGPDRDRRRDPATPARRGHHRPGLGPARSPPHGTRAQRQARSGRLTTIVAGGASS